MKSVRYQLYCRISLQVRRCDLHTTLIYRALNTGAGPAISSSAKPVFLASSCSKSSKPPLSLLPLNVLLRSYLVSSLSSSPSLLTVSLRLLSKIIYSDSTFLSTDRNTLLRYLLKNTLYVQFCAGEETKEVENTLSNLKKTGYHGVILAYAKETAINDGGEQVASEDAADVEAWKQGNLQTLRLSKEGDFVAIKYAGS